MNTASTGLLITVMVYILVSNHLPQAEAAPAVSAAPEDIMEKEIEALCTSLCQNPGAICPPECFASAVDKRALRVSRGRNFKNLRFRVNAASSAPSSFDDYIFMKLLGQNMIGNVDARAGLPR